MYIGNQNALQPLKTTDLQILTDLQEQILQSFSNGLVGTTHLCVVQCIQISRVLLDNSLCNVVDKFLEFSVLCNKVGFRVNLYNCAYGMILIDDCSNQALSSNSACFLRLGSQALFTQNGNCLFYVTVCLDQCLLAVHNADTGALAQLVYFLSRKISHCEILHFRF